MIRRPTPFDKRTDEMAKIPPEPMTSGAAAQDGARDSTFICRGVYMLCLRPAIDAPGNSPSTPPQRAPEDSGDLGLRRRAAEEPPLIGELGEIRLSPLPR